MRVRVMATPGHTFNHLSYVLEEAGEIVGVFTGGSLLYGSTGRTDLLGPGNTSALTHVQYASARRLARELPDGAAIFPTHGFGSFCAATQTAADRPPSGWKSGSTRCSPSTSASTWRHFSPDWIPGPPTTSTWARPTQPGPAGSDLSPPRADAAEVRRRIEAGEWVVDLRDRIAFAAGFVPGSFSFPLDGSFATYLGWAIPWGTPVTLLGETPEQIAQAQRELARIGIDRPAAAATGQPENLGGRPAAGVPAAGQVRRPRRRHRETAAGLSCSTSAAGWSGRKPTSPGRCTSPSTNWRGGPARSRPARCWIHCHTGYRSTVASSMLAARGRRVINIDDDFDNAEAAGVPLERPGANKEVPR